MSYTKRQIVEAALGEIGLASYAFDLMPEQREAALKRLDSLMAEWNGRGLRLAYPIPNNPADSDIDTDSGLPDMAWDAAITNLAIRIAPSYGKMVNPETKITARHALNTLMARAAMPNEMRLSTIPSGAGNKSFSDPFLPTTDSGVILNPDPAVDFE
jgi:hypothetical protein